MILAYFHPNTIDFVLRLNFHPSIIDFVLFFVHPNIIEFGLILILCTLVFGLIFLVGIETLVLA